MDLGYLHDLIGHDDQPIRWWQMSLRATVVFLVGLLFLRLAARRVFGKWGALDIIVAVIVGSNLSRTITGGAPFGPTLCATALLIGLHAALAFGAVHLHSLGDWVKGRPVQLIEDGRVDEQAMRRHGIGHGDLQQALRRSGVTTPDRVAAAFLERSGEISVIRAG